MRGRKLKPLIIVVYWGLLLPASLFAQENLRTTAVPEFEAKDVLPESLLAGEHYRIEPQVKLVAHHYQFVIVTRWGKLPARGINMLLLRLHELNAIEQAFKERWAPKELEGALKTLLKTPEGALMILSDPIGTVFRTPRNLKRLAAPALNEQDRRAGVDVRRRLAARLGCDPETRNPILKALLDQLALREKAGNLAGKIGLSVAVPGLGLLSLNADMQNDIVNKLPSEINKEIDAELAQLGSPAPVRKRFLDSRAFTTTERLVFMAQLRKLKKIPGAVSLVENAAAARDESQALSVLEENRMLLQLVEKHPDTKIEFIGLPVARLEDDSIAIVASVDLLSTGPAFENLRETLRKQFPTQEIDLRLAGGISSAARKLLAESKIAVTENLRGPLIDREKPEGGNSPAQQD
jgi:hypothetical protein